MCRRLCLRGRALWGNKGHHDMWWWCGCSPPPFKSFENYLMSVALVYLMESELICFWIIAENKVRSNQMFTILDQQQNHNCMIQYASFHLPDAKS